MQMYVYGNLKQIYHLALNIHQKRLTRTNLNLPYALMIFHSSTDRNIVYQLTPL